METAGRQCCIAIDRCEIPPDPGRLMAEAAKRMAAEGNADFRLIHAVWLLTDSAAGIDSAPYLGACGPCASCLSGRDQAKAYLAEHDGYIAIGLLTYLLP